jgi:hypothetical protein
MARETKNIEATARVVMPPQNSRRPRRSRYLIPEDSFWDIAGMSDAGEGPTNVSENKHQYLAEIPSRKTREATFNHHCSPKLPHR